MKILIRLYPRDWRARYGDEIAQLIADQPRTIRLALDLIAGAIDARLHPQFSAGPIDSTTAKGGTVVAKLLTQCQPYEITSAEYRRSVIWLLGTTLVLSWCYLGLKRALGDTMVVEAFGVSTFPIAVLVSSWETYLKRYSAIARLVIIAALGGVVFLLSITAASLGRVF